MFTTTHLRSAVPLLLTLSLVACEGPAGTPGEPGPQGDRGPAGDLITLPDTLTEIQLPGTNFYPEGIAVAADGTFYVGSSLTGVVVRRAPDQVRPEIFIPAGVMYNVVGMIADDDLGVLWACAGDLFNDPPEPSAVIGFDLITGEEVARHPLADDYGFCNDFALADNGDLYASDTYGQRVVKVAADDLLTDDLPADTWAVDDRWAGTPENGFGTNGMVQSGEYLYVVNHARSSLFRVPIAADGSAGEVTQVLTRDATGAEVPVAGADGLKLASNGSLIVVEGFANRLTRIDIDDSTDDVVGTLTPLATRLDAPTTFVLAAGSAWVVEGQFDHLTNPTLGPPELPFRVVRMVLADEDL